MTIAILASAAAFAGTVYVTPPGLAPGTQYQLVFVTTEGTFATSTNIADYNTFVTNEANQNAALAGLTWTIIGSTPSVNANVNAPSTRLVYTLNGVEVASAGLYGGSLLAPIDINQSGNVENTAVWTGSVTAGTVAGGINDLGQTFTEYGDSSSTTGTWIQDTNGIESNNNLAVYALSSEITVPQASAVPEPGTWLLIGVGILGLAAAKHHNQ